MNFVTPSGFRDVLTDEARAARAGVPQAVQANMAAKRLPAGRDAHARGDGRAAGRRQRCRAPPFQLFDARGDLAGHASRRHAADRAHVRHAPGGPAPGRSACRYMQRVFREAEGQTRAEPRETTQMGVELHRPGGRGGRRRGRGPAAPSRSSWPAWPTSQIALASVARAARAARKLRGCAAVAPGGARCLPRVELRARSTELTSGDGAQGVRRRCSPSAIAAQLAAHPRRARRHRRGAARSWPRSAARRALTAWSTRVRPAGGCGPGGAASTSTSPS